SGPHAPSADLCFGTCPRPSAPPRPVRHVSRAGTPTSAPSCRPSFLPTHTLLPLDLFAPLQREQRGVRGAKITEGRQAGATDSPARSGLRRLGERARAAGYRGADG